MIKDIEEYEYRALPEDSSSSLKMFSVDRRKYRKRYILKEHVEDKDSDAATMGRLVETILMEPERFDELFYMSACATIPGGLMGEFIGLLVDETVKVIDEDTGALKEDFLTVAERAYEASSFKIKFNAVMKKFDGDAEIYYNEAIKVKFNKLTVVTPDVVNNAEKIVRELQENSVTATLVNLKTGKQFEVVNQLKIAGFEVDGLPLKSMLDKVIIDHSKKYVQIYDLKCTWNVEKFYKEYYLYRKAYIQGYIYYKAVQSLCNSKEHPWFGYEVLPPKFIVCDSINYFSPLIYDMTDKDLEDAYKGFESRGYKMEGVKDIIENLKWARQNDIWTISRENFNNVGHVKLEH